MERIKNLSKTQKVLMVIIAVMIVAFSIMYPVIMSIKGVEFRGDFLTRKEGQGNVTYTDGYTSITVYDDQRIECVCYHRLTEDGYEDITYGPYSWTEDPSAIPAETGDGSLSSDDYIGVKIMEGDKPYFRGAVAKNGYMIYNAGGTAESSVVVTLGTDRAYPPEIADIVSFIVGPQLTNRGNILFYIFGIVICIIAVLNLLFPDELFKFAMWPRVRNLSDVESSDWELAARVIGWYVLTIGAFVVFVMGLTMVA